MSSEGSITRWIAKLEIGRVDEAQEQIWRRYFHRLAGLANVKLGETPRRTADEEDVAIAALHSFFGGVARGKYPSLKNRDDLWPLLAKITAHKALDQQRYVLAKKRGGGAVRGDSALAGAPDKPLTLVDDALPPDALVAISEECKRLLALLPDEQLRTIARRRLEGYKNAEIAKELGVIPRTVERRLQLIRSLWGKELAMDRTAE